jgi:hypothetical protein
MNLQLVSLPFYLHDLFCIQLLHYQIVLYFVPCFKQLPYIVVHIKFLSNVQLYIHI